METEILKEVQIIYEILYRDKSSISSSCNVIQEHSLMNNQKIFIFQADYELTRNQSGTVKTTFTSATEIFLWSNDF